MAMQFYLTDAGRNAVIDQFNIGLKLNLTHIVIGTSKYDASIDAKTMKSLKNQINISALSGGLSDPSSTTLVLIANIETELTADIYEVGFLDDKGILFAVASNINTPLMRLASNVTTVATFSFTLTDIDMTNIKISLDANSPLAVAIMAKHIANENPHPQYLTRTDYDLYEKTRTPRLVMCGTTYGTDPIYLTDKVDDLRSPKYNILITPESQHEGWEITRNEKSFLVNVWERLGTEKIPYGGAISWAVFQAFSDDVASGDGLYTKAGTYTISILAGEKKLIKIAGGGGGGSISLKSNNNGTPILVNGFDGAETSLSIAGAMMIKAGGGGGSKGGIWGNGSSYDNGIAGGGGQVTTYDSYSPLSVKSGNSGTASRANQNGGESASPDGAYGVGGNGRPGIGDNGEAFGGGGGSGAFASIEVNNTAKTPIYITLKVGRGGGAQIAECFGTTGYAKVETLS